MSKKKVAYVIVSSDWERAVELFMKKLPDGNYRSADASAMCFPASKVKTWDELTEEQKSNCLFSAAVEMEKGVDCPRLRKITGE